MRNDIRLPSFLALLSITVAAHSQTPPAAPPVPALATPTDPWFLAPGDFSRSDPLPALTAPNAVYGWFSGDGPGMTDGFDGFEVWEAESQAGRGQAAVESAWNLMFPLLTTLAPDCKGAMKMIDRAEEIGEVRAAYLRGMYYATACGKEERARALEPLRIAADRDNAAAAAVLGNLYAKGPKEVRDPVLAYVYAGFVAKQMENVTATWPDWIDRPKEIPLSRLKAADRPHATELLNELLAKSETYRAKLAANVEARKAVIFASDVKAPGWSYVATRLDATGECANNLNGNCRGVPRWVRVEIHNTHSVHLQCEVNAKTQPFAGKEGVARKRVAWIAPGATRDVNFGLVKAEVLPEGVTVSCAPIALDARTKQAETCRAKYVGELRADSFYPQRLERLGVGGVVKVRVLALPPTPGKQVAASDVEVVDTSGNTEIDQAAVRAARSVPYLAACTYGITMLKLTFAVK